MEPLWSDPRYNDHPSRTTIFSCTEVILYHFYPSALLAAGVLSSAVSVRPSVRPSVCPSVSIVTAITFEGSFLFAPNLVRRHNLARSKHLLKMGDLDLYLQGHSALENFWLVRAISQNVLDGISPNLHRICFLHSSQHLLNMGDPDIMVIGSKTLKIGSFWPYLHDQSQSHFFTYGLQTWCK